jgi:hypothetical protein
MDDDDNIKTVVGGQAVSPAHVAPPPQGAAPAPSAASTALGIQDQLIHFRLTWLGTFSGFLVIAAAFASNNTNRGLVIVISLMGMASAASIFVGTFAANRVLWRQASARPWDQPYPRVMFWLMPGTILPILLFLFWFVVAFVA